MKCKNVYFDEKFIQVTKSTIEINGCNGTKELADTKAPLFNAANEMQLQRR